MVSRDHVSKRAAKAEELERENGGLRERLEQAEETLRAIRSGEVDALIVGEQVYTLQGLDAESNKFRGDILAQVNDAVIAVDNGLRITYLNQAAARQYDISSDLALGSEIGEVFRQRWPPGIEAEREKALATTGGWRGELVHVKHNGKEINVEVSVSLLQGSDGKFRGELFVIRDITARKRIEGTLQRTFEQLERTSKAKDQFLAMLSHELRTPLTPVLMAAAALENDSTLSKELREQLGMIRRNIELEARLIDDLLDVSRIAHGKLKLRRETVDVHSALEHALSMSASDVHAKKLQIQRSFAAPVYHTSGDGARLQEVFSNILRNAIKFTPVGGSITVATSNLEDRQIQIEFSDTGIGIEPELQSRIFDVFEQGRASMRVHNGGLGLGLTISKRIIDLHQGSLTVESNGRGKGTRFIVRLEGLVKGAPERRKERGYSDSTNGTPVEIVLVEDHKDTVQVLHRLLRRAGHGVTLCGTIAEARAAAATRKFDLIISDVGLPDGSGLDLMRHLRDHYGLSGIALSGYGSEADLEASRAAGFVEHLTKPLDWDRLRQAITRVLQL